MVVHDRQTLPSEPAPTVDAQITETQVRHLPIDEQETQTCKAVVPVMVPSQRVDAASALIVTRNLKKMHMRPAITRPVLNNVTLQVERGEFLVVTGPPGAGKSVLLHVLGCLVRPSGGAYWLGGSMVSLFPTDDLATLRNQHIGFVFREPALLPRMSALKNVALPLLYAGFSGAEQKRRAQKMLQFVSLDARQLATPEQLSPGQQQRVAIARALVNSPSLLLIDEPTGNMDTRSGREIMAVLQALNRRNLTIILATQNVDLVSYAKRHVILRDGCIASDKPVAEPHLALDDLAQTTSVMPAIKSKEKEVSTTVVRVREEKR